MQGQGETRQSHRTARLCDEHQRPGPGDVFSGAITETWGREFHNDDEQGAKHDFTP